ncbi:15643_t:CDS:2, partial [Gigaspora rosea]
SNNDDEKTIKELKAFILKCGVRKVWSRELAGCDSISSQINRLNKILSDLGITGRPTLEKCKKVRQRRELEAELNSMDVGNIISDDIKEGRKARASRGIFNPTGRRIIHAKRQIE